MAAGRQLVSMQTQHRGVSVIRGMRHAWLPWYGSKIIKKTKKNNLILILKIFWIDIHKKLKATNHPSKSKATQSNLFKYLKHSGKRKARLPSTEAELASEGSEHSWIAVMNNSPEGNWDLFNETSPLHHCRGGILSHSLIGLYSHLHTFPQRLHHHRINQRYPRGAAEGIIHFLIWNRFEFICKNI